MVNVVDRLRLRDLLTIRNAGLFIYYTGLYIFDFILHCLLVSVYLIRRFVLFCKQKF